MFLLASTVMGGGKDITFFSCWMKSMTTLEKTFCMEGGRGDVHPLLNIFELRALKKSASTDMVAAFNV